MVNSGSFDAAGSEGESAKAEFTQLQDGDAPNLTDFAAVVPDTSGSGGGIPSPSSERDDGLTTPPQATMTTLNTTEPPATPTKASLQCSVPLDKVKNVLEMCRQSQSSPDKTKFNSYFILENYLKQKQKTNELSTPCTETSSTTTESTICSNSPGESSKPIAKRLLCLFCERTFTSNNLKQKHVDRCHSTGQTRRSSSRTSSQNQSTTACCFCSKLNQTEHTLKELLEHLINEHSNRYYACLSCQERFTSAQALRDHNKVLHGIEDTGVSDNKTSSSIVSSDVSENSVNVADVKRTKSEAQTKSSPSVSGKTLKRNSSLKINENTESKGGEQRESGKSVGFHVDFEDSILANVINPEDIKKSKENDDTGDSVSTRKSRSSASSSKNKPTLSSISSSQTTRKTSNVSNKKISVKSTKNGVRSLRTTRASVKQLNNFNKTRKNKIKSDSELIQSEPKHKSLCNPASVFSLVNAYIYKYEKIYDHASDSIKDANSVQFNAIFDREFYLRTVCNIRENLLNHLDGKLNRNIESESRISNFEHNPALAESKSAKDTGNFGCDLSLNAVTPVATLLASSQYGEDFDAQIEYGAKASQKKQKKIAVVKYKFPNKKYNSLFRERDAHTDLTSLDMWTQLTVKNRQSKVHDDGSSFDSDSPFFDRASGFEAKHQVEELNSILDKRGPFEDLLMEANAAQFLELRKKSNKDGDNISEEASKDIYFILDEILNRVVSDCNNDEDIKQESNQIEDTLDNIEEVNLELPHYFQLQRSPDTNLIKIDKTDSIALICSSKDENDKSDKRLELTGEWTRPRIYICAACGLKLPNLKSLDDHKNNDHPHIWCSHYEFVGNQSKIYRHLSIPGLGKVSVIEAQPQNRVWQRSDARICSKCTKQCHNLGELHKHILECGGDWTWMLARKKCKYRPYGARTRRRRQRGYKRTCNPEVSRTRELKPKNKSNFIGPRPKPSKPSDAETIERMLANLPPKRNRKMISMRDGIQRPRKPYKQSPNSSSSHLNISSKSPNKHFKNNSPQITLRSALKRKLAMSNLRKQKGNDSQDNISLKLRSKMKNDDRVETKNIDTEPLSNKSKLRNKRMISRILGSKIFDSNTAIVTRRRLVQAITQNNLIRKTRLRTKMLEANAQKLEAQVQKDEPLVETEASTKVSFKNKLQQEFSKESKRKNSDEINQKTISKLESNAKTSAKSEKLNLEISTTNKPVKKSNSKRLLSVLTKSSKKPKTTELNKQVEGKNDTISAVIDAVVSMVHKDANIVVQKSESIDKVVDGKLGLRRTRSTNKLDLSSTNEENKTEAIDKEEIPVTSNETKQPVDSKTEKADNNKKMKKTERFGRALGKKTSKLMQNVKSFGKNIKQTNENKSATKNESIASKLIRTFSIRGSKRKKNKTDDIDKASTVSSENISIISEEPPKEEFKKTTIQDPPNITDEIKETENEVLSENNTESSQTIESEMPILEKINPIPEEHISDSIILPVLSLVVSEPEDLHINQEMCDHELQNNETKMNADIVDDSKDIDFKQSDEKLNANCSTLNKFRSKMKRSGRGLNDCIAMLKCKLEQKICEPPPLVDKSNLFILNSLELNKHSLVSENSQINTVESTKLVLNEEISEKIESIPPILEDTKSQDAIDLSVMSKSEMPTLKSILEVPNLNNENNFNAIHKKEQMMIEVSTTTVEIETQTHEEDISLPEYLPHIQSNIQLSSLLNATLKNCLMECVKNKCEELKNETQIVRKSSTKDRKIGSVRKKRIIKLKTSDLPDKPALNIPLLLNTAFTETAVVKSTIGSTNSSRTTAAEDTSEDDLPLSKLVSSSSVESKLKVTLSVAKKKRSAKKQIAFTPLILNSPDTCIPQISLQERLEQRISLEHPDTKVKDTFIEKQEKVQADSTKCENTNESNVPNSEERSSIQNATINELDVERKDAEEETMEDLTLPIEEKLSSTKPPPESLISSDVSENKTANNQVEEKRKYFDIQKENSNVESENNLATDQKITPVTSLENHLPLAEQVMLLEDEPLINYLVNKTLTETNVEPTSSMKNAIQNHPPTENIELNKHDCIDSGKENSDVQGIKKQKKLKKTRGKRKSRGKLNATDSQIDYSTSLESPAVDETVQNKIKLPNVDSNEKTTEKVQTSAVPTKTIDDVKEEIQSTELTEESIIESVINKRKSKGKSKIDTDNSNLLISEIESSTEQLKEPNADIKKKIKSPKKIANVASIIEAIEAAIQSSIKIQDEIDHKNTTVKVIYPDSTVNQKKKRTSRSIVTSEEDSSETIDSSTNDESNSKDLESEVSNEDLENLEPSRKLPAKVNFESENVAPEVSANLKGVDKNEVIETSKVDEISVEKIVKKKRGRVKKVVQETLIINTALETADSSSLILEELEMKRTTRTKPKVNYVETDIVDPETVSEESNDLNEILINDDLKPESPEITENLLQYDGDLKRVTRGKKIQYFETETQSDSEASEDNRVTFETVATTNNEEAIPVVEIKKKMRESLQKINMNDESDDLLESVVQVRLEETQNEKVENGNLLPIIQNEKNERTDNLIEANNEEESRTQSLLEINSNVKEKLEIIPEINNDDIVPKEDDALKKCRSRSKKGRSNKDEDLETIIQSKLEFTTNTVEALEIIPIKPKAKRGRKPRNKDKLNNVNDIETISTSIIDVSILGKSKAILEEQNDNIEKDTDVISNITVNEKLVNNEETKIQFECLTLVAEVILSDIKENNTLKTEDNEVESSSVLQEIVETNSNMNKTSKTAQVYEDNINTGEKKRRSRDKPKHNKEPDTTELDIVRKEITLENDEKLVTNINSIVQNGKERRRSCVKIKLNYHEPDEIESDESSATDLNVKTSLEEIKIKQRSRSNETTTTLETENNFEMAPQGRGDKSFLHPEEIKSKRRSRSKMITPIQEIENNESGSNLEVLSSISSDDSSFTMEVVKPKRRTRLKKVMSNLGIENTESNSDLDMASSLNSNAFFINPHEIKPKRRSRGKSATNLEVDNESESSLNTDESSTNPEEIEVRRKSHGKITFNNGESENNKSKTMTETAFSVINDESSPYLNEIKKRRRSRTNIFNDVTENIETNSKRLSSNEDVNLEENKINNVRIKLNADNLISNYDESSKNLQESTAIRNSGSEKGLITLLKDIVESSTVKETIAVENNEEIKSHLKITIANKNLENDTLTTNDNEASPVYLEEKSKRRSRSKISIVNKKTLQVEDKLNFSALPKEDIINFNLSFANIKNKLKSRLETAEEVENVEPNTTFTSVLTENIPENVSQISENTENNIKLQSKIDVTNQIADVSNSVSEPLFQLNEEISNSEDKTKRAPKLKITLVNPETEIVESSITESQFSEDSCPNLEEIKNKRRSRSKIMGNPESENIGSESSTNSAESVSEKTENKEKKKRRSFIKIKLNLPEPEVDDLHISEFTADSIDPEINSEPINDSSIVEIKKKRKSRKKESELLEAAIFENYVSVNDTQMIEDCDPVQSDVCNLEKVEPALNMEFSKEITSKFLNHERNIENASVKIGNNTKLHEELLLITKPQPKKRGRKPKNAKINAKLNSSNLDISVLHSETLSNTENVTGNNQVDSLHKPLGTTDLDDFCIKQTTEIEESMIESERKSRRPRPKINYQEIENEDLTDLSSDSELSIKESIQDESTIVTEDLENFNIEENINKSVLDVVEKDSLIAVEQQIEDVSSTVLNLIPIQEMTSNITVPETTQDIIIEMKPKKKRGRKKSSVNNADINEQKDVKAAEYELEPSTEIQIPATTEHLVIRKPRGRGRPSTKVALQNLEKQNNVSVENLLVLTPDIDKVGEVGVVVPTLEDESIDKRKSRNKVNYQELENPTSPESISDIELKSNEKVNTKPVYLNINTDEIITPKKRGRKPKRKNLKLYQPSSLIITESVVPEPVIENNISAVIIPENVATITESFNEEIQHKKKRSRSKSGSITEEISQIIELNNIQEEHLPILKIDMKKRRHRTKTLENQSESENTEILESNLEDFNTFEDMPSVSSDGIIGSKIKKKRRSRSKNSETMSQQNIASAIELLTNVENTIESLKEFTKDKPLTNNFKNQLQENIEYEAESIMECKNIQDLTSIPNLNVTVAISPSAFASDSEDELPLSILIKNKPETEAEGIIDCISKVIPEIITVNESSLISENSLLGIDVAEINFAKAENKLILSTHNSFDFDDDNIIDQEELSQLVDITSESLLENIQDDYISTINSKEVIATNKILDEIKQGEIETDENDLDEIIEDLEIVTKCIPLKTDSNIVPSESFENLTEKIDIDKSAEELLNLIDAEEEPEFIQTPDLKDTSLIIKIKKNFNVHIRKAKKGRRRVIPKSLNKSNIRRKEEEDAVCEICNKSFKRKETLASHKKTLTHIAKLSEIEERENQARRISENERDDDNIIEVNKNAIEVNIEDLKVNNDQVEESNENEVEIDLEIEDKVQETIPEIKCPEEIREILDADESSCENEDLINIQNASTEDKTLVPVILNVSPEKSMNNILPGLIVNSTNSTLKLIDIINEVLDKPVPELNINDAAYSPQNIRKSPTSCDSTETFSEPKRYKSLGERKSFDSDSYTMTPKCTEETKTDDFNTLKPITNGEILCKQLSILENIIEETSPSLNNYIDDSVSLSSSQFEEPLPEQNISDKVIDYTKFSHTADVLSSLIKPNHFNNFENISESFTKPVKHQQVVVAEHSQHEEEIKKKVVQDNSTRKILNRDEELFLECCSLLKSGSEISGSKKSTKQIQLNSFSRSNDATWIMQKQQNSDRFIQRDSYSWLAQSSRVETPIGEPFVNNDWSNSNSAVSSEWLAQKAPSPDRPTESNTILKKSNNNSEESKYTDLRFEDISIDSSLETSKTLMAVEHSNTENIPLDFHHVDFSSSNLQQTQRNLNEELVSNNQNEVPSNNDKDEDTSSRDEYDPELKKKVASTFSGLMAKALSNRLHAVVRKTKKSKGKRNLDSTIQSSITDYTIPVKRNKLNQTDSDSSDCPKKLITKGAMKVFEGIKVSIPTQDLNLKEVLNCSTKTKKTEVDNMTAIKEKELDLGCKNGKIKHLFGRFGNKLGLREKKKKTTKRRSPKSHNITVPKSFSDIYEFEESQDNTKSMFSSFQTVKENSIGQTPTITMNNQVIPEIDSEKWNAESESDTDRYYDSMSFEEQSLSSESTPETTTPVKIKPVVKRATEKSKDNQKKCMIMGRIFKNASKPKLEDKIPEIRDFTSEENSKVVGSVENVENGIVNQPPVPTVPNNNSTVINSANKMSKKEMDMLFDKLVEEEMKMHEKEKVVAESNPENEVQNEDVFSKPLAVVQQVEKKKSKEKVKMVCKPKKRQRHNSDSTSSDEFRLGGRQSKSTKKSKAHRKPTKPKKESGINLEQEMKECIGVAGRKSQRKCTSGKQNVLVEFWSSDESSFEEVLNLIEKQNENKTVHVDDNINEEFILKTNEVIIESNLNSVNNSIDKDEMKKPSLDIYDFESDPESRIEEFHPKAKTDETSNQQLEDSEFLAVNKIKIPRRIPKPKRNRKHSKNDDESASEYEAEKTRRRQEHKRKKMLENASSNEENGEGIDCLAVSRRKRNAGDQLYYWSSSSDDEMQDLIEVKPIREDNDDDRPMHHGWIVGDSPKKLVTMLAQAKGKKIDGESVKEQGKKNRVTL